MTRQIVIASLMFGFCVPVVAAPPKERDKDERGARSTRREVKKRNQAARAMGREIEDATLEGLTFEDFTDWLARETRVNVVVRWRVLEREGVERDYPLYIQREKIAVRDLLRVVFREVTADLYGIELAAKAEGNAIIISTRIDLNRKMIVRTYDVQDLFVAVPQFKGLTLDPFTTQFLQKSVDGGVQQANQHDHGSPDREEAPPQIQQLIDVIVNHVDPLSWRAYGGKGTIVYFRGRLVVRNHVEAHQQIGGVLAIDPGDG